MSFKNIVSIKRDINKCKHCRINHRCLPASLSRRELRQNDGLHFKSVILTPGEHLIRQGDHVDHLFAIRSGLLKSYTVQEDGNEYVMGFLLPPSLFGWESIDHKQLTVSVVALEHSNVCLVPINKIETLSKTIPNFEMQLLQMVSQRIQHDNAVLLRTTADQRVAQFLLQLAKLYTLQGYPYYLCKVTMTHQDIANYLRIAPETISRILRRWHQNNIISLGKHKIYLNDIKQLKETAKFEVR